MKKILFWTPRILTILYIVFLSIFAFDVFDEHYSFWQTILALFMHLIPCFVLIIILVYTWRREWIGGVLFITLGVFYIIWAWGKFVLMTYFFISGPLFLVGILFLINWKTRKKSIK